jgi:hypothetical protein
MDLSALVADHGKDLLTTGATIISVIATAKTMFDPSIARARIKTDLEVLKLVTELKLADEDKVRAVVERGLEKTYQTKVAPKYALSDKAGRITDSIRLAGITCFWSVAWTLRSTHPTVATVTWMCGLIFLVRW